jgi:hypothetical protein
LVRTTNYHDIPAGSEQCSTVLPNWHTRCIGDDATHRAASTHNPKDATMTSILRKSLLVGAILASATPAFAQPDSKDTTTLRYNAKTHLYCLTTEPNTGSFIPAVTCQSAAKWTAAGLNMPKSVMLAQR